MSETMIHEMREAIAALDQDKAAAVAGRSVSEGLDPLRMINDGIRAALEVMGERFASGNLFLPEMMLGAKAADAAVAVLEPELLKRGATNEKLGRFLIATVKDDIHDIGKNIVALLMKSAGFEVFDLGVDKTSEEILKAAQDNRAEVIGLSALLTTTMPRMKEFIELLQESGLRGRYKVILGGAPVTKEFAEAIGADGYAADAARSVDLTKRLLNR
ncbi:MAG: cobalamin-dependent protein [Thermodesulfobacteriota bacterium]